MPFNFANLPHSAFVENSSKTGWADIYPTGTLLVAENGLSYRALEPSGDAESGLRQMFAMQHPDRARAIMVYGHPAIILDTRVVWYPTPEEN